MGEHTEDELDQLEAEEPELPEWRQLELAASASLNVALTILTRPHVSEAVLRRLAEARPDFGPSIATKRNAPVELIEALPVNTLYAGTLEPYMWRIGADIDLWRTVRRVQDTSPMLGGPPIGEFTRAYRIAHEHDADAHRQATARWRALRQEDRDRQQLVDEVRDPTTTLGRLVEIARDQSVFVASAVLQLEPPPPEVISALIETHPDLAEEMDRFTNRSAEPPD
ncbi:hypothetical protein ACPYO6_03245 [Georgenia sp. Z1344]|uniref:hypothetical protein n=1 Tax=Georgenia sp. Z1344 TaxID=3416706 RepID=UPI003CE6FB69